MDAVGKSIVECAIGLIMTDMGPAVLQDCLCILDNFPFLAHAGRMLRHPLNLACIEDRINTINEAVTG